MRIAAERGLFGRVGEEIEQIPSLEADREAYFDRILGELDRAVDRIDAASSALRTCSTSSSTRPPSGSL